MPASFNTLNLFSVVTRNTNHMVTVVNSDAKEKRLAFNGWWGDGRHYDWRTEPVEDIFDTRKKLLHLTAQQYFHFVENVEPDEFAGTDRHERLEAWRDELFEVMYQDRENSHIYDVHGRYDD